MTKDSSPPHPAPRSCKTAERAEERREEERRGKGQIWCCLSAVELTALLPVFTHARPSERLLGVLSKWLCASFFCKVAVDSGTTAGMNILCRPAQAPVHLDERPRHFL